MMATAAVIGLSTAKRLISSSFCPNDLSEKFYSVSDHGLLQFSSVSTKSIVVGQTSPNFGANIPPSRHSQTQAIKALKEHSASLASSNSAIETWLKKADISNNGDDIESSLEVLILLQKSMLEKQWELPFNQSPAVDSPDESFRVPEVARSGISARQRRMTHRRKYYMYQKDNVVLSNKVKQNIRSSVSPELLSTNLSGYVRGTVSESLLSHAEVVSLSKKIKTGLSLEKQRIKLKEKLGFEPSDKELASTLKIPRTELHSKLTECSLARAKLAMSNVRLVLSIAQKYDNLGVEMADLVQGGLIGLLRGIEKFDSSKGFRISTYVYWWIRQGVSRALVGNCRTLRLPTHLHERLSSIRNAKIKFEEKGITPSIAQLAESLNMSQKKVRNATEAVSKVLSLDREAFPSLNGLPGETLHSYIADRKPENNPWHGFEEWSLKDEVNQLLHTALNQRERDIIRLYHGIGSECHTWEDISRMFGLSRERVRQVGLVAMEKLKHAARKKKLEAMLVKK